MQPLTNTIYEEVQKEYYNDREIKPSESIFLKLSIIPFGTTGTPNLRK